MKEKLLGMALSVGIIGVGAVAMRQEQGDAQGLVSATRSVAVAAGVVRARPPQQGDEWGGRNDARAAGTAPIYRDEPGYRPDMDGDDDGIACEPHRED